MESTITREIVQGYIMSTPTPQQKSFGFKILEEDNKDAFEEVQGKVAKPGMLSSLMTQR